MSFTYHEHTKMYECDAQEEVVAYPNRLSIKLIVLHFNNTGDQIKLTDDISSDAGESADDTIVHLFGTIDNDSIVIPFDPPIHVFGLNVATISSSSCKAFIYIA